MVRQLKQGTGWRLGWDADAPQFKGLVGSDDWAIELTEAELDDFCRLVVQLDQMMGQMGQELMEEERIGLEVESDRIWLEAEGFPQTYQLRLIVLTGRGAEGTWSEQAVPPLVQAVQMLKVF
ncbi:DUF1818 family protein [Leptolyngbya sp. GB1-A1]|uniref:DUF1818 family protein n=1 Tax=Leptolyngbya sp. GB1-A1 TaxID=2933908 RepID=UPI0032975029